MREKCSNFAPAKPIRVLPGPIRGSSKILTLYQYTGKFYYGNKNQIAAPRP